MSDLTLSAYARQYRLGQTNIRRIWDQQKAAGTTNAFRYSWIIFPFVLLAVSGCVKTIPERQYWGEGSYTGYETPHDYSHHLFNPDLFVLEFQEDGGLLNERPLDIMKERISALDRPGYLFIYIHGWKYNAYPDGGNLRNFNGFLETMQHQPPFLDAPIIGLYLGWRGQSVEPRIPLVGTILHQLSYSGRQNVADAIGDADDFRQSVSQIADYAANHNVDTVLMGHSLGGRILERAALADGDSSSLLNSTLAILINPASDRDSSQQLQEQLLDSERPVIASLGARNDLAIRHAFPTANFFSVEAAVYDPDRVTHYLDTAREIEIALGQSREALQDQYAAKRASRLFRGSRRDQMYKFYRRRAEDLMHGTVEGRRALALAADNEDGLIAETAIDDFFHDVLTQDRGQQLIRLHDRFEPAEFRFFSWLDPGTPRRGKVVITSGSPDDIRYSKGYWIFSVSERVLYGHGGDTEEGIFDSRMAATVAELYRLMVVGENNE